MATEAEYEIWIHDPDGARQKIIPARGFMRLEYINEVNGPGVCFFDIPSRHSAIPLLEYDGIVTIRRRKLNAGLSWYEDWGGLYVDRDKWLDNNRMSMFRAICVGYMDLLAGETVAWPANKENRSYFDGVAAETIAKTLVTYNAVAASATEANGRDYDTDVVGVTVAADGGFGNTLTKEFGGQNLLAALHDVATVGGGDFDLIRTSGASYQFRWYQGQRGSDRSNTVKFALQYRNMESPRLTGNRMLERTRVVVLGQGAEGARPRVVRTGANFNSLGRNRTVFVESNDSDVAALQAVGDVRLSELQARDDLQFVPRQTAARQYGRDYQVGDLVGSFWEDAAATKKIIRGTVIVEQQANRNETILIETENA